MASRVLRSLVVKNPCFALVLLAAGCNIEKPLPARPPSATPAPSLAGPVATQQAAEVQKVANFGDLWHAYHNDMELADRQFTGKRVELSVVCGPLHYEGKAYFLTDQIYTDRPYSPALFCYLAPQQADRFRRLRQDQTARVRATVVGPERDPRAYQGLVVVLTDCELVEGAM
jgi:hypothetical protein